MHFSSVVSTSVIMVFSRRAAFRTFFGFFNVVLRSLRTNGFAIRGSSIIASSASTTISTSMTVNCRDSASYTSFEGFVNLASGYLANCLLFRFEVRRPFRHYFSFVSNVMSGAIRASVRVFTFYLSLHLEDQAGIRSSRSYIANYYRDGVAFISHSDYKIGSFSTSALGLSFLRTYYRNFG